MTMTIENNQMHLSNPLVSVIIPSFNQGDFLELTIKSVLSQSYKNFELIVVDGMSSDRSYDVLMKYKERIDVLIVEADNGQSDAINKGMKRANGNLVGWINSDDVLKLDCLALIVKKYIETEGNGVIYFSPVIEKIDVNGKVIGLINNQVKSFSGLLNRNYSVAQPGSFYLMKKVKEVGFINPDIHYCMDLDLWLRLLKNGSIYVASVEPLAQFRLWSNTKTSSGKRKFLKEIECTLNRYGMAVLSRNWIKIKMEYLKYLIKDVINR